MVSIIPLDNTNLLFSVQSKLRHSSTLSLQQHFSSPSAAIDWGIQSVRYASLTMPVIGG
ncbi:hypothetical protein CFter6_0419 [Collimonas fungivorans]|uniref:Uncharacterized protein n=1 Tax=Collimonas fungivorans TaxID=158899 RepID=A0A127P5N0_9BURK|nr:hypothetical protein CFter6_0419 [Collimonas fungivorans]